MTGATGSSVTRSNLPPTLLRAYRDTRYEACGVVARIGRRSAAMDAVLRGLGSDRGGFITAWNPASRKLPEAINRRRQQRLLDCLRGLRFRPGQGSLRHWQEGSLLVAADPGRLAVLARRFGQNAIVVLRVGQMARLKLL